MPKLIAAFLLLAVPLIGQDAASIALGDAEPLPGLASSDALTRATAARVLLVRGVTDAAPKLREALGKEHDPSAAREQIRALVILGSDEDVAFAALQLQRFPASIDGDFAEAVGRTGAPRATTLYLRHVAGSRNPEPAVNLALWGRTAQASASAARLLGAKDAPAFGAVLRLAANGRVPIDSGVLASALTSDSAEIVDDASWYLVETYAADRSKLPEAIRSAAAEPPPSLPRGEAFGRELLRRMIGAKPTEHAETMAWLKSNEGRFRMSESEDVRRLLTAGELAALRPDRAREDIVSRARRHMEGPEFRLPIRLPAGLGSAILKKTRCGDLWIGVATATVDRAGRVQTLDAKDIGSTPGCQRALETMLRLSLAEPAEISSPLASNHLLVIKPRGDAVCFDEDPVDDTVGGRGPSRIGGEIKTPKVVKRVEPAFPKSVRQEMEGGPGSAIVVVEAIITRQGCVRSVRLVGPSRWPKLNSSALLSVAQWTFEPGTLNGKPVEVIFNLTVNFKLN